MEAVEYTDERLGALIPWPDRAANKYTRGRLVVVGGSALYPGAACLAAFAGQRMGAGYVEVACDAQSVGTVRAHRPSLVVRDWDGWSPADLPASSDRRPLACVVGPGFDAADYVRAALALSVLEHVEAPVLVDGGAIAALATLAGADVARRRQARGLATVVTPHGGEAARMARSVGIDPDFEPASLCLALARAYACTVALKGPDTYVSDGACVVAVRWGTPALAKAGTGDVLAGMVGALLAQGLTPLDAAVLGATLHAEAGRVAAERLSDVCVTPEDVIDAIPQAVLSAAHR